MPATSALDAATRDFLSSYDWRNGGFGGAPKFPRPSELLFLLAEHRRTGDRKLLDAVAHTLTAMAAGGMRDQIGGGFHRYSVDARWRVPHFEKMLYDQAQLVLAYLEAAQATGDRGFIDVAEDTLRYVQRDMTSEQGAFFSAEDADSLPPGAPEGAHATEGAFYLWSMDEIERLLGPDAQAFCERYGVERDGNALTDPHGEFTGRNILYEARPIEAIAGETDGSVDDVTAALKRARQVLLRARNMRPRPQLDDKVLTAWNGLMIGAFARASRVVPEFCSARCESTGRILGFAEAARGAASFIRARMWNPTTRPAAAPLSRRRGGHRRVRRGLRLPDLRPAGAVRGGRRPRVARLGARTAAPPGRPLLGRRVGRVVQHRRPRPDHPVALQGGLRRRGAGGEFSVGPQPADARAPWRCAGRSGGQDRADAEAVRRAADEDGPSGADDADRVVGVARRPVRLNLPACSLVESEQWEVPVFKFLLWLVLLVFCWPLALIAILLYPVVWLLLLPFRLLGIAVEGVLELVRAVVLLPARVLSFGRS